MLEKMLPRKIRVGVLFGGQSSEHEVSLASARSVMKAMDPDRYEVVPIGITKGGSWIASGDPMAELRSGIDEEKARHLTSLLAPDPTGAGRGELVELSPGSNSGLSVSGTTGEPIDVIFPVLHGPYGEDGTIQGMLETAGIPYVGSQVLGSAVGMDKGVMKGLFISYGLPVVPYLLVSKADWEADPAQVRSLAEEKFSTLCSPSPQTWDRAWASAKYTVLKSSMLL